MTRFSFWLTSRHLRRGLGRQALSIAAVGLGVALVVGFQIVNQAVLASFLNALDGLAGRTSFAVRSADGAPFDEETLQTVAGTPGVATAVPLVTAVAFLDDESGELLTIYGVDLTNDAAVRVYHRADTAAVVPDRTGFLAQPNSVIVARQFATRHGLSIDGTIGLVTPSGPRPFVVGGIMELEGLGQALEGRLLIMDIAGAQQFFGAAGKVNQIDVIAAPGSDDRLRARLEARLPRTLTVEEPELRKSIVRRTFAGVFAVTTAFGLLTAFTGFFVCYSRLRTAFEARNWQVGLLRSIGLRPGVVVVELTKEGLLLGVLGVGIGIPLGVLVGHVLAPYVASAFTLNYGGVPGLATVPKLTGASVALGLAVGLTAATCAAAIPAFDLARRPPAAALAIRGRETAIAPGTWLPAVIALSAGAALAMAGQAIFGGTVLGIVATLLLAIAGCAAARLVVGIVGVSLRPMWASVFGPAGDYAAMTAVHRMRSTTLVVATIGVGVGAVLMFGIIAESLENTIVDQLSHRYRSDLFISSPFIASGYRTAPLGQDVIDAVRSEKGVQFACGEQRHEVEFLGEQTTLDVFDPACFREPRIVELPLEDVDSRAWVDDVAAGRGALISSRLARQSGVRAGQVIELASPGGTWQTRVLGVTDAEPERAVIVSRDAYRSRWADPNVTRIHVVVQPNEAVSVVRARLAESVGKRYRVEILSTAELLQYFRNRVRQAFSGLIVLRILTLVLLLIGIGDTLATSVLERSRELGLIRAMGLRGSTIFATVLLEGVAIGVSGIALGTLTGTALGILWVRWQFPAMLGWLVRFHMPWTLTATAAAWTIVAAAIGSVLPALRAARLSVVAALRTE